MSLSDEFSKLAEKATRGPFSTEDCPGGDTMLVSKDGDLVCYMGRPEDVALFIATHNAFPVLLAALELAEARMVTNTAAKALAAAQLSRSAWACEAEEKAYNAARVVERDAEDRFRSSSREVRP